MTMFQIHYDTLVVRRRGLMRDVPAGENDDRRWVASSATLIYDDEYAVLVDTFLTINENERLIDRVKEHGRNLTHIFVTHGHADHTDGIGQLRQAFPDVQHDQHPPAVQQRAQQGALRFNILRDAPRRHAERVEEPPQRRARRHRSGHRIEPVQVHVKLAVGKPRCRQPGEPDRQCGLPHPGGPGDQDE
jgi:glyoxylase-like metal-dependent hydrolase (beta-lactamase superfamily II)